MADVSWTLFPNHHPNSANVATWTMEVDSKFKTEENGNTVRLFSIIVESVPQDVASFIDTRDILYQVLFSWVGTVANPISNVLLSNGTASI